MNAPGFPRVAALLSLLSFSFLALMTVLVFHSIFPGLPGSYDAGAAGPVIVSREGYFEDALVQYYDFGPVSNRTVEVYRFYYENGTAAGHPMLFSAARAGVNDTLPGDEFYSPVSRLVNVTLNNESTGCIHNLSALERHEQEGNISLNHTGETRLIVMVSRGAWLEDWPGTAPALMEGWCSDSMIYYLDFGEMWGSVRESDNVSSSDDSNNDTSSSDDSNNDTSSSDDSNDDTSSSDDPGYPTLGIAYGFPWPDGRGVSNLFVNRGSPGSNGSNGPRAIPVSGVWSLYVVEENHTGGGSGWKRPGWPSSGNEMETAILDNVFDINLSGLRCLVFTGRARELSYLPQVMEVVFGPVKDHAGKSLTGVTVVFYNDTSSFSVTTEAGGIVRSTLPYAWINEHVNIRLEKDGYESRELDGTLGRDGTFDLEGYDFPPPMEREGEENGTSVFLCGAALALMTVPVVVEIWYFTRERRGMRRDAKPGEEEAERKVTGPVDEEEKRIFEETIAAIGDEAFQDREGKGEDMESRESAP